MTTTYHTRHHHRTKRLKEILEANVLPTSDEDLAILGAAADENQQAAALFQPYVIATRDRMWHENMRLQRERVFKGGKPMEETSDD